jgi:glutamine synthetase
MNPDSGVHAEPVEDVTSWLAEHEEITSLHAAVCDLNGILRGKRIPVDQVTKVLDGCLAPKFCAIPD